MRNLKVEEYKEVNGGTENGGKTATGKTVTCGPGTAPHLGDHGDKKGPHCDSIRDLPTTGAPGKNTSGEGGN